MRRITAAAAAATACLMACASPAASTPVTPNPGTAAATPTDLSTSKAADLRTRLDLLLGEQVFIVAKESAAASEETDAYPGYVALLSANESDLADLFRQAFGNTAATQLGAAWSQMNRDLVEYAVGLITHKQSQADISSADLANVASPAIASLLSSLTRLPPAQVTQRLAQVVAGTKSVATDAAVQNFPTLYTDLHAAHDQAPGFGDMLSSQIVRLFPDKFPGDLSVPSVTYRVSLNGLMQEHAYLATMATGATIAGRSADRVAATTSLAANATALGAAFNAGFGATAGSRLAKLWAGRYATLLNYAAGDTTARVALTQQFVSQFSAVAGVAPSELGDQATAALMVVDDQRAKAYTTLATDDRAAATGMQPIADALSARGSVQG
ncbi:MAG: hypothetical protein ACHQ0J_01205 [Candidatus Dormibacterales bacterium]